MDQQTNHDILDVRARGAVPYSLPRLALSLPAILILAAVFVALAGLAAGLMQLGTLGIDETRSFYLSLRFDVLRQTQLRALAATVVYTALIGATITLAVFRNRRRWRELVALSPVTTGWKRNASIAVMVLIYAGLASLALARLRERHIPIDGPTNTVLLVLLMVNLVCFAPVAEELLFRGWIYTGLRHRFRFGTSLFATSLLFAAIHWEPRHMVLVLPLAFALGFIREQSGSIKPTIVLHGSYNFVIVVITLMTQ